MNRRSFLALFGLAPLAQTASAQESTQFDPTGLYGPANGVVIGTVETEGAPDDPSTEEPDEPEQTQEVQCPSCWKSFNATFDNPWDMSAEGGALYLACCPVDNCRVLFAFVEKAAEGA